MLLCVGRTLGQCISKHWILGFLGQRFEFRFCFPVICKCCKFSTSLLGLCMWEFWMALKIKQIQGICWTIINNYGVHLQTKIIENKIQFEVQKLDYPCRNLVIWIWNRNEHSRNSIIRTWSYFEQVETIKGKLDIADVEVQINIPTKMQITWFELQFTFSTLISHLIVNNATIIFHKIPNETFNLNLKSIYIFEFEKPKFQFERKQK